MAVRTVFNFCFMLIIVNVKGAEMEKPKYCTTNRQKRAKLSGARPPPISPQQPANACFEVCNTFIIARCPKSGKEISYETYW